MLLNNLYAYSTSTSTLIAHKSNSNSTSTCSSLNTKSSSSLKSNLVGDLNIPRKNNSTTLISLTTVSSLLTNNNNNNSDFHEDFLFDNNSIPFIPTASNSLNDIAASFQSLSSSSNNSYIPSSLHSSRSYSNSNNGCISTTPSLASILTSKKSSSYLNRLSKSSGSATYTNNNKLNLNMKSSSYSDLSFSNSLHSNISANSTSSTIFESSPNCSSLEFSYTPSVASWTRPSQLSTCQPINSESDLHPLMEIDAENDEDEYNENSENSSRSSSSHFSDNESTKVSNNQIELQTTKVSNNKTRASKLVAKSLSFISLLAESTRKSALLMNASTALSFNTRITDTRAMYYNTINPEDIYKHLEGEKDKVETTEEADDEESTHDKETDDKEKEESLAIQLTTFKTTLKPSSPQTSISLSRPTSALMFKSREPRLNSQFLRFYAQDYSAKSKGLLGVTDYEIDLYQEEQEKLYYKMINKDKEKESILSDSSDEISSVDSYAKPIESDQMDESEDDHEYKNLLRIGYLSREKLWSNVILAPREDNSSLNNSISYADYKFIEDDKFVAQFNNNSLTRLNGECIPWINYKNYNETKNHKFIKPFGHLPNQIQFTVKGWANERWIEHSH